MRNKAKEAQESNVQEENVGKTLRLKDNPSREDLRKAKSPLSKVISRFQ